MAEEWYDKKLLGTLLIAVVVVALIIYAPAIAEYFAVVPPPPAVAYKYTTDLTVGFKIMDDSTVSLVTADMQPSFYVAGTDPYAINFVGQVVSSATFDSATGQWIAVLDAGTYVLVISDQAASKTKYPLKQTVTVTGTNNTDLKVNLSPYMVHMVRRATPAITNEIWAFNVTTGAYDIDETLIGLNVSSGAGTQNYTKWLIEYRIPIAGLLKGIRTGRLYLATYTGLSVSAAYLDGVQTAVYTDTESSDDAMTGYYISFTDWAGGVTHYLQVYITKTGSPSAGTLTLTLYEYYECHLAALRWWTDETEDVTVTTV